MLTVLTALHGPPCTLVKPSLLVSSAVQRHLPAPVPRGLRGRGIVRPRSSNMLRKAAEMIGAAEAAATVRVATYNILSPNLCSPGYFRQCDPEALEPEGRLEAVMDQLEGEVKHSSVIGLQEVSLDWVGPLQTWFSDHNYRFIQSNYGNHFNGYMGVGIAYPQAKYELLDADLCRLSDTKEWPKKPEDPPGIGRRVLGILAPVGKVIMAPVGLARRLLGRGPKTEKDPWEYSRNRFNHMVSVRLRDLDSETAFWVSTYHMPCAFYLPPAMVIHVALAAQHSARLASRNGEPYVLCGDFNIKPGDSTYGLITTGSIQEGHPDIPGEREWDPWTPSVKAPMKSAYAEVCGSEPNFTNYAQAKDQEPFIDCLDYIFISQECRALGVKKLPHRSEVQGPLPTLDEPSDHILIASTISIPPLSPKQERKP